MTERKNMGGHMLKTIRPWVFLPPFLLLMLTIILNFVDQKAFIDLTGRVKQFMVGDMGWLFSLTGVACLLTVVLTYLSPLGKVRLGGPDAKPLLTKPSWFAVTL